jgi:curli biogenesis system outer membrane secretion channel CsgG
MKPTQLSPLGFLWIFLITGCASQPSQPALSKQRDLIQPLLQTEFKSIIESAPEGSRVGVDWCFDLRYEDGTVSVVSDWVQRQIEKLLVDSKKFIMVSRRYLANIQREQELQASSRIDEKTAVSICRNLGLSYLVVPEITPTGTLSIQLIDAETDQIYYVNLVDFY